MMDLHSHSNWSDGSETPYKIVKLAKEAGLALLSLADHDTTGGVAEATAVGAELGVAVLPAIEIDIEGEHELHMLAYALDTSNEPLRKRLREVEALRDARNALILKRLAELGAPVSLGQTAHGSVPNRTHIAKALLDGGYVKTLREAFAVFLGPQGSARFNHRRMGAQEAIALIRGAGGFPVMAHPGQYRGSLTETLAELAELGLWGIEAYYPAHTAGQVGEYRSLASRFGLQITCGSDFHGSYRPHVPLGAVSRGAGADPLIQKTEHFFLECLKTLEN